MRIVISYDDDAQSCFNDGQIICLFKISQNTSQCIAYDKNLNVLEVQNYYGLNYCFLQSQISQKTIIHKGYCYKNDNLIYLGRQVQGSFKCDCPQNEMQKWNKQPAQMEIHGAQKNFTCITTGQEIANNIFSYHLQGGISFFNLQKADSGSYINSIFLYNSIYNQSYNWLNQTWRYLLINCYLGILAVEWVGTIKILQDFAKAQLHKNDNQCLQYDPVTKKKIMCKFNNRFNIIQFCERIKNFQLLVLLANHCQPQNIDKCLNGFCIYMQSESNKFCVALGSFVNGNQFIGAEKISQICLQQLQPLYLGIFYQ
ncbi:hypothetical protein ABPG72_009932 [Tetrahymena utriculariae]